MFGGDAEDSDHDPFAHQGTPLTTRTRASKKRKCTTQKTNTVKQDTTGNDSGRENVIHSHTPEQTNEMDDNRHESSVSDEDSNLGKNDLYLEGNKASDESSQSDESDLPLALASSI